MKLRIENKTPLAPNCYINDLAFLSCKFSANAFFGYPINTQKMPKSKTINKAFLLLTTFVSLAACGQRQIVVKQLDQNKLPKGIKYEGKIKTAVRWTDSLGDNIVVLTETGVYQNKKIKHENDGADAELFAYNFIVKSDSAFQTWKVYDFIADCPLDIEASFIKNTFRVTDLDNNGVAEIWLMYKTACQGDVSPCDMKIIMYQGKQKFAMRGRNKVVGSVDDKGNELYVGGEYKPDKALAEGPKAFLDFAKTMWNKNIMQTWEK
jgi:hypothetical protein